METSGSIQKFQLSLRNLTPHFRLVSATDGVPSFRMISHIPELSQYQDGFIHAISCILTKCHLICRDFTFSYRFPLSDHRVISMWSEVGTEQFLTDQNWECLHESYNSKADKNYPWQKVLFTTQQDHQGNNEDLRGF